VYACPALQTLLPPVTWALQFLLCQVQVHGAAITMLLLFMFLMFPSLLLLLLLLMPPLVVFLLLLFLLLLCLCEELFQCAADLLVVLKVTKELTAAGNHGLAQHAAQHNAPHMGSVGVKGLGVEGSIGCGYEGYTSSVRTMAKPTPAEGFQHAITCRLGDTIAPSYGLCSWVLHLPHALELHQYPHPHYPSSR
jgi:hypothetical protein